MYLFTVYVTDHIERTTVCVGDMLTRMEAGELKRILEKFQACEVTIVATTLRRRREGPLEAFI